MNTDDWKGDERRGIPIHILNYMDERLNTHVTSIEDVFNKHTSEEMSRYSDIMSMISDGQEASAKRHESIMNTMIEFHGKCKSLHNAFLKLPDGSYDFDGHRDDHNSRKKLGEWWNKLKGGVIAKLVEWGSLAFVIWMLHSMWESFLKGPIK